MRTLCFFPLLLSYHTILCCNADASIKHIPTSTATPFHTSPSPSSFTFSLLLVTHSSCVQKHSSLFKFFLPSVYTINHIHFFHLLTHSNHSLLHIHTRLPSPTIISTSLFSFTQLVFFLSHPHPHPHLHTLSQHHERFNATQLR